nr:immunoglobulin heavy chain junction region [Macaca mulatta]
CARDLVVVGDYGLDSW